MGTRLEQFYRDHIEWRRTSWQRSIAYRRHLENHAEVASAAREGRAVNEFRFRNGWHASVADGITAQHAFDEIFVHRTYRVKSGSEPMTIVDAGANTGLFTLYALRQRPSARIFAVEANPSTYDILRHNVHANQLEREVTCCPYALGSRVATADLFCTPISGHSSLYNVRGARDGARVSVSMLNWRTFCEQNGLRSVDYLKMDIEGGEYEVILEDPTFFEVPVKEIWIELHRIQGEEMFQALLQRLSSRYRRVKIRSSHGDLFIVSCHELSAQPTSTDASP